MKKSSNHQDGLHEVEEILKRHDPEGSDPKIQEVLGKIQEYRDAQKASSVETPPEAKHDWTNTAVNIGSMAANILRLFFEIFSNV